MTVASLPMPAPRGLGRVVAVLRVSVRIRSASGPCWGSLVSK